MGSKSNIESYNLLKKCTQTFLNNNANSARTSDNAVTIAFEEFKKFTIEKQQNEEMLIDNYKKNHDIPRKEKEFAYEVYVTDKLNLRDEWIRRKDMRSLMDFLQFEKPENIELANDPIYTIYS
jgi:hypothetical protein